MQKIQKNLREVENHMIEPVSIEKPIMIENHSASYKAPLVLIKVIKLK
jgi:hypothetical protein